jgi:hypothetical protein
MDRIGVGAAVSVLHERRDVALGSDEVEPVAVDSVACMAECEEPAVCDQLSSHQSHIEHVHLEGWQVPVAPRPGPVGVHHRMRLARGDGDAGGVEGGEEISGACVSVDPAGVQSAGGVRGGPDLLVAVKRKLDE